MSDHAGKMSSSKYIEIGSGISTCGASSIIVEAESQLDWAHISNELEKIIK